MTAAKPPAAAPDPVADRQPAAPPPEIELTPALQPAPPRGVLRALLRPPAHL